MLSKYVRASQYVSRNFYFFPLKNFDFRQSTCHTQNSMSNIRIRSPYHRRLHSHIFDMKSNWNEVFRGWTAESYHLWLGWHDMSIVVLWSSANGKHGWATRISKLIGSTIYSLIRIGMYCTLDKSSNKTIICSFVAQSRTQACFSFLFVVIPHPFNGICRIIKFLLRSQNVLKNAYAKHPNMER